MKFLEKKERVIDFKLTPYGKSALARGEFRPIGYDFYDDDIIYDEDYASSADETQNAIQDRILEGIERLEVQTIFSGRETQISRKAEQIRSESQGQTFSDRPIVLSEDKNYFMALPIGSSDRTREYSPAWNIVMTGGEFTGSVSYFSSSYSSLVKIPQLTTKDYNYDIVIRKGNPPSMEEGVSRPSQGEVVYSDDMSKIKMFDNQFDDGSFIEIIGDCFLTDIMEENVRDEKENFDLEVYIVESGTSGKDVLVPLSFAKKQERFVDGILLDEQEVSCEDIKIDSSFVEYYFDVFVDKEIEEVKTSPQKTEKLRNYKGKIGKICPED